MEKQLIDDIKQILIEYTFCSVFVDKKHNSEEAIKNTKEEARRIYNSNPKLQHFIDYQTAAIVQKIKEYGYKDHMIEDLALEDRKRAELMNQRQIIEQARLKSL